MKICKDCSVSKELTEFHKNGKWFRNKCKKCHNFKYQPATGKPNRGRYKKGNIPINPFKKGHTPWIKGKTMPGHIREKLRVAHSGKVQSDETIEKRRKSLTKDWSKYVAYDRHSTASRRWSKEVRNRDKYICQKCFNNGGPLHAHHIKSWKDYPMLRFCIDNGISLCVPCHKKEH